jgi:hypothetical protein
MIPTEYWINISHAILAIGFGLFIYSMLYGIALVVHGIPPKKKTVHYHYGDEDEA